MSRPSEKAASIAEELVDYVHPGMSRGAAIDEIATMIDEMNTELLEVVNALMTEVEKSDSRQHAVLLNHLHEILVNYKPMQVNPNDQHQLFSSATETQTAVGVVAGQMP